MLTNDLATALLWGPHYCQICGDAFLPVFGSKHPRALGQPASEANAEVWATLTPLVDAALHGRAGGLKEDVLLETDRHGFQEETYWTFTFSGVPDAEAEGGIGGVLVTAYETTQKVIAERRLALLHDLAASSLEATSATEACARAASVLERRPARIRDLPGTRFGFRGARTALGARRSDRRAWLRVRRRGAALRRGRASVSRRAGTPRGDGDRKFTPVRARTSRGRSVPTSFTAGRAADGRRRDVRRGLSARKPLRDVGGDWYDALRLRDGRLFVSIGDVAGSGVEAAVTMEKIRYTLRGIAQIGVEPGAMLDAADGALHGDAGTPFVTAFVGVLDPATRRLTYASAGHPRPLLRRPDRTLEELAAHGAPLGLRFGRRTAGADNGARLTADPGRAGNVTVDVPSGSLCVLYTDGLTEYTRDLAAGERLLRDTLRGDALVGAERPALALQEAFFAAATPNDDVAILTIRVD